MTLWFCVNSCKCHNKIIKSNKLLRHICVRAVVSVDVSAGMSQEICAKKLLLKWVIYEVISDQTRPNQTRPDGFPRVPHPRMTSSVWFEVLQGARIQKFTVNLSCLNSEEENCGLPYLPEREHKTNLVPTVSEVPESQLFRCQPGFSTPSE